MIWHEALNPWFQDIKLYKIIYSHGFSINITPWLAVLITENPWFPVHSKDSPVDSPADRDRDLKKLLPLGWLKAYDIDPTIKHFDLSLE